MLLKKLLFFAHIFCNDLSPLIEVYLSPAPVLWMTEFPESVSYKEILFEGIDNANTAADHLEVMKKAYELGKEL